MSSSSRANAEHPEDLLEAFSLDALDPEEESRVSDHLGGCLRCALIAESYQQAAAFLVSTVESHTPPDSVRVELLAAVAPAVRPARERPARELLAPPGPSLLTRLLDSRFLRVLTPVTAAAAVVMIAFALTMNVRTSDLLGELQDENASLRDQLDSNHATISANFSVVSDSSDKALTNIQELRDASYVMAMAANQSLLLEPLTDDSPSQGVLLTSAEGDRAVLMVSNMRREADTAYNVWLFRDGERHWAGTVNVDSRGWGTVALEPPDSLSQYEMVGLTMDQGPDASSEEEDLLLRASLQTR